VQVTLSKKRRDRERPHRPDQRRPDAGRGRDAAKYLVGKQPDDKTLMEAAKMAAAKSSPSADRKGSVEYKKEMARVLTRGR